MTKKSNHVIICTPKKNIFKKNIKRQKNMENNIESIKEKIVEIQRDIRITNFLKQEISDEKLWGGTENDAQKKLISKTNDALKRIIANFSHIEHYYNSKGNEHLIYVAKNCGKRAKREIDQALSYETGYLLNLISDDIKLLIDKIRQN